MLAEYKNMDNYKPGEYYIAPRPKKYASDKFFCYDDLNIFKGTVKIWEETPDIQKFEIHQKIKIMEIEKFNIQFKRKKSSPGTISNINI